MTTTSAATPRANFESSEDFPTPEPATHDKTAFSMVVPSLAADLAPQTTAIIVGIETHICVTQTALDLLAQGHRVYILADGVSSCNSGERGVALRRLAREGATVTTSESVLFELLGDAKTEAFKGVSGLVKETKEETKSAVEVLCADL